VKLVRVRKQEIRTVSYRQAANMCSEDMGGIKADWK
jgi:hypothetical protein